MKIKVFLCFLAMSFVVYTCDQMNVEWKGTLRMENGVRIVENPREPIYSGKILSLKEELNLGGTATDQGSFARIKEIDLDREHNIYVLDWMAGCVLVFDQDGKHLRTIGRKGQGPGELQRPMDISVFGGQLMVHDLERCLSFFTLDGKFVKSITSTETLGIWDIYYDSIGNILAQTSQIDFTSPKYLKNPKHFYIKYDQDLNKIYQFADTPCPGYLGPNNPFAAIGSMAIDREDNVILGYADEYAIQIFYPDGRLVKKIKRNYKPVRLSTQDRREMKDDNPGMEKIEYPKYKPPFRRFFIDDEGRIFVGTWQKLARRSYIFTTYSILMEGM